MSGYEEENESQRQMKEYYIQEAEQARDEYYQAVHHAEYYLEETKEGKFISSVYNLTKLIKQHCKDDTVDSDSVFLDLARIASALVDNKEPNK